MENIIKESIVHYRGDGSPYVATAYGSLKLTASELTLDYYIIGFPTFKRVYGLMKRKIEVPIKSIKDVSNYMGFLVISYITDSKINKIYVNFTALRMNKLGNEWIEEINKLISPK